MPFRFNPITGQFDLVNTGGSSSADNFSYETIPVGVTVIVPQYQMMIVQGLMTIEGVLTLDGVVVLIN